MKQPTVKITKSGPGAAVEFKCPHGNEYDRTKGTGMHCSKEGCQCEVNNKSAATQIAAMFPDFAQFLK